MNKKEQILKLRSEGKSYREIEQTLRCGRGLVSYYLNPSAKTKQIERNNKNRYKKREHYKNLIGGKCQQCGYNKCLDAFHFHHKNPKEKSFVISSAVWGKQNVTEKQIIEEISKCELLCANCHAELHSNTYQ